MKAKTKTKIKNVEGYLFIMARNEANSYFRKKKPLKIQLEKIEHSHFELPNHEQYAQQESMIDFIKNLEKYVSKKRFVVLVRKKEKMY